MLETLRVRDYMTRQIVALSPNLSIADATTLLMQYRISAAPVVENRRLVGMLSEADCLHELVDRGARGLDSGSVRDYMSTDIDTIAADESILAAAESFLHHRRKRLPVVDCQGKLVGQISRRDVLRAVAEHRAVNSPAPAGVVMHLEQAS